MRYTLKNKTASSNLFVKCVINFPESGSVFFPMKKTLLSTKVITILNFEFHLRKSAWHCFSNNMLSLLQLSSEWERVPKDGVLRWNDFFIKLYIKKVAFSTSCGPSYLNFSLYKVEVRLSRLTWITFTPVRLAFVLGLCLAVVPLSCCQAWCRLLPGSLSPRCKWHEVWRPLGYLTLGYVKCLVPRSAGAPPS